MGKPPAALVLCWEPLALCVKSCMMPKVVQHMGESQGLTLALLLVIES